MDEFYEKKILENFEKRILLDDSLKKNDIFY